MTMDLICRGSVDGMGNSFKVNAIWTVRPSDAHRQCAVSGHDRDIPKTDFAVPETRFIQRFKLVRDCILRMPIHSFITYLPPDLKWQRPTGS